MSGSDGQLSAAGAARGASLVMELLAATVPTGAGAIARVSAAQRKPDTIPPAERERERERERAQLLMMSHCTGIILWGRECGGFFPPHRL